MKTIILVLLVAIIAAVIGDQYTDRYDSINIDEILANRRLLIPYIKCMLDQGRCTPEGKELKVHVKDAMQSSCEKCTPFQKVGARKVVKHIREYENDYWEALKKKYDPDNTYRETYEAFLAADD